MKIRKKLFIKDRSISEYILLFVIFMMIYAKYSDYPKAEKVYGPQRSDYPIGDFPPYHGSEVPEYPNY